MFRRVIVAAACMALGSSLLLDAATAASKSRGSQLHGKTSQGRQIRLKASAGKVQLKHFTIQLRCRGGAILIDEESGFLPSKVGRGGKIHDVQVGSTDEVLFRGRLKGSKLRGKIRVRDKLEGKRCDSKWVKFTARPKGGR